MVNLVNPQCGGIFLECKEEIIHSLVNLVNPQCGGIFLECKEEIILSVGDNFYSVQKKSSVWGNIVKGVKKNPRCGGILLRV